MDINQEVEIRLAQASAEANKEALIELKAELKQGLEENRKANEKICAEIQKIKDELSLYKHFIFFLKLLGYSTIAIATLKFGDLAKLWGR